MTQHHNANVLQYRFTGKVLINKLLHYHVTALTKHNKEYTHAHNIYFPG